MIHFDPTCTTACKDCVAKPYAFKSAPFTRYSFSANIENIKGRSGIYNTGARPTIPFALFVIFIFGIFLIYKIERLSILLPTLFFYGVAYFYFRDTDLFERQYDLFGHVEYLKFIATNHRLPPIIGSWENHQAPFYYLVTSLLTPNVLWAQFLAFISIVSTMTLWAFFVRRFKRPGVLIFSFIGVPAFWYLSARINNDVFLPFFSVCVMVFWLQAATKKGSILLGITLALMLFTKISAISIYLSAGLATLLIARVPFIRLCAAYLPGMVTLIALLTRTYLQTGKLLYLPQLHSGLVVGNDPSIFLTFNFYEYFTVPAAETWQGPIREKFWEFLFMSGVSGEVEFVWNYPVLVTALRALVLLGALTVMHGVYLNFKKPTPLGTYAAVTSVTGFAFLFYHRLYGSGVLGAACNGDARFLVPLFPSFAVLIALSIYGRLKQVEASHL